MSTRPAVPEHFVLDGLVLAADPNSISYRADPRETVRRRGRIQLALSPQGREGRMADRTITLAWSDVKEQVTALRRVLAPPGPYQLVAWRWETLWYPGNGVRSEFLLPWPQAIDLVAPPSGAPPTTYSSMASLAGIELTVLTQDSATYDGGPPPAGELWIRQGGTDIKINDALPVGQSLLVDLIPIIPVVRTGPSESRHVEPVAEPANLVLQEAS